MKNETRNTELGRKADAILRTLDTDELARVQGGTSIVVVGPGGGGNPCGPQCGILHTVEE
jgi:hypothetical protein